MRIEYVIGNEDYRQLSGPGSSYYTSVCDMCGLRSPSLHEIGPRMLICPDCSSLVSRNAVMRQNLSSPPKKDLREDFWIETTAFLVLIFTILVAIVGFVLYLVL